MDLEAIRQDINTIDAQLVALLEKRMTLVDQVTAYKRKNGKAVLDRDREKIVIDQVAKLVQKEAYRPTIENTFRDIMTQSRHYQSQQLE